MIKLSVMYPCHDGARLGHDHYCDQHMPMLKNRMGKYCKYYTDLTPIRQISEVVVERSD